MVFFLNALLNSFNSIKKDLEKTENLCETHEIVGAQKSGTTAIVQTLERISELLQQYTKPPTYGDTNSGRRTDFT